MARSHPTGVGMCWLAATHLGSAGERAHVAQPLQMSQGAYLDGGMQQLLLPGCAVWRVLWFVWHGPPCLCHRAWHE